MKENLRKSASAKRKHHCENPYLYKGELEADVISRTRRNMRWHRREHFKVECKRWQRLRLKHLHRRRHENVWLSVKTEATSIYAKA